MYTFLYITILRNISLQIGIQLHGTHLEFDLGYLRLTEHIYSYSITYVCSYIITTVSLDTFYNEMGFASKWLQNIV